MKLNEIKFEYKSKQYLAESWNYLTEEQQVYFGSWEKNVWPLVENYSKLFEAELTQNQIQDIFKKAEKVSMDSGGNATVLGKAGKISGQIAGKLKTEIEIDGGINFENCKSVKEAGANILVSGSTIFNENQGDLKKNIGILRTN